MWFDYIQERLGKMVLKSEVGFAIIDKISNDNLYLEDVYIKKEFRSQGFAQKFSLMAYEMAKLGNYKYLTTSVNIKANNVEYSTRIILENGFKFSHIVEIDNMIYFKKEVK